MRVLVTGAAGFIGSHLAERLAGRGDAVVGVDNLDETLYPATVKIRTLSDLVRLPGFAFVAGDFLDEPVVAAAMRARPDAVVHLGALAGVRPSIEQPIRYARVNVQGTLGLLEACRRAGVGRFVFASSSSVYGETAKMPFTEDAAAEVPASPYAATKRAGELMCASYAHLHGIGSISLRFFTVYGPRGRPDMAIASFLRAVDAGDEITLYGDGTTSRDYTYVDDIIDGIVAAVDRAQPGGGHAVYNLGHSRPVRLADLVALVERAVGKPARVRRLPMQPGDVRHTFADLARASRDLGYAPRVPIEEGLRRTIAWTAGRGGRLPPRR